MRCRIRFCARKRVPGNGLQAVAAYRGARHALRNPAARPRIWTAERDKEMWHALQD
ncbi:hypothetical protein RY831_28710 [Noviherbaspirillum sp. CPCC 100848]|uniref:Transposase n=1 Tax=Noviherbaspirillum album TaxID=3080276 RepID=A0ABU6JHK3_9BURK|nr:hypothetical protein [Noviherbaspirillum sp. CPCC 100848]MEC4723144.1 hypothetical protein [Noviherbaspirillum sp. CPCC 100848]